MSLVNFTENNNHALLYGTSVPSDGVNLCFIDCPVATPEGSVVVMNSGENITNNVDDPLLGLRSINVSTIVVGPSNSWTLGIKPGSFYFSQSGLVTAGVLTLSNLDVVPSWVGTVTGSTGPVTVRWDYSVSMLQARNINGSSNTHSDSIVVAGAPVPNSYHTIVESPISIGNGQYKLKNVPLITDDGVPLPEILLYSNGLPVWTVPTFTTSSNSDFSSIPQHLAIIVDSYRGIIQSQIRIPPNLEILVQYVGTRNFVEFSGFDSGEIFQGLDLNPTVGHYCGNTPTVRFTTSSAGNTGIRVIIAPISCTITDTLDTTSVTLYNSLAISNPLSWILDGVDPYDTSWITSAATSKTFELAHIMVRPPVTAQQLMIYDTRTRGGGVPEDVSTEQYPEAISYFDVSHLDGDVSIENGVVIVKIPDTTYNALVAADTSGEVRIRSAIESSLAAGTAYLIDVFYTITASVSGTNGAVSPQTQNVSAGSVIAPIVATPATNYSVNIWQVDGITVQTGGNTYVPTGVVSSISITVSFEESLH